MSGIFWDWESNIAIHLGLRRIDSAYGFNF
jgi:hypothetical protein